MKPLSFISYLFFLLVAASACKKHTPGGAVPDPTDQDYFDCKINGVQWAGPLTDLHLNGYVPSDSVLSITAYREGNGYDQELLLVSDQVVLGDTGDVIAGSGGVLFGDYDNPTPCAGSYYNYNSPRK